MFQDFRYSDTAHLSRSDEVLKLKNFKKDATLKLSKSSNQEWYEHVGPEVASPQDGKVTRWRRDCAWLMISRCSRSQCQIQVQGTSSIQKSMITTTYSQEKVKTCEEYSQEVLGFSDNSESGNPTLIFEPIIAKSSPSLTPFEGGDFILEEIEAYLASDPVPPGIDDAEFDPEGDIRLIEEMLNNDPYSPLLPKDLKCEELKSVKPSIDEPPKLKLKDLPSHLEYAFLEGTNKLPVIIAKNLKDEEKERLIKVLKSHKQAITWKLSDIKVIGPQFCTHKILMEDDFKLAVQH
ncbi:hypothetical protein Tco_0802343 [Tanacetum coccineum]|uniref:Reverse transcriptase domain-containing protein n=1 Tax=Tanacetum coccineum TaxID=301880 RepID=A0ABQ4ZZE6_9ASTR